MAFPPAERGRPQPGLVPVIGGDLAETGVGQVADRHPGLEVGDLDAASRGEDHVTALPLEDPADRAPEGAAVPAVVEVVDPPAGELPRHPVDRLAEAGARKQPDRPEGDHLGELALEGAEHEVLGARPGSPGHGDPRRSGSPAGASTSQSWGKGLERPPGQARASGFGRRRRRRRSGRRRAGSRGSPVGHSTGPDGRLRPPRSTEMTLKTEWDAPFSATKPRSESELTLCWLVRKAKSFASTWKKPSSVATTTS